MLYITSVIQVWLIYMGTVWLGLQPTTYNPQSQPDQSFGLLILCLTCGVPFLAGVLGTVLVQSRLKLLGLWGLVPFGGMIKQYLDSRPE